MLFFPVGETAITTSTLFPQRLQSFAEFLDSDLAATSVFDLAFPDIILSSFPYGKQTAKFPFLFSCTQLPLQMNPFQGFDNARTARQYKSEDDLFYLKLKKFVNYTVISWTLYFCFMQLNDVRIRKLYETKDFDS